WSTPRWDYPAQDIHFRVCRRADCRSIQPQRCQRLRVVRIACAVARHSHRDARYERVHAIRSRRLRRYTGRRTCNVLEATVASGGKAVDDLRVALTADHRHILHALSARWEVQLTCGATSGAAKGTIDGFDRSLGSLFGTRQPFLYGHELATAMHKHM